MRVRDVMASPVVTVAPGAALKEVASLLVERLARTVPGMVEVRSRRPDPAL